MMIKILVDKMPVTAKECPFAEYIGMTSRNKCRLLDGMLSRRRLECDRECDMLKVYKEEEKDNA